MFRNSSKKIKVKKQNHFSLFDHLPSMKFQDQLKNIFLNHNSLATKINQTMALVNHDGTIINQCQNCNFEETNCFPDQNPNPVLRVSDSGKVYYTNLAGRELLNHWYIDEKDQVSPDLVLLIQETLKNNSTKYIEIALENKYFSITILPLIDQKSVNIYGLDITHQRLCQNDTIRSEKLSALCQLAGGFAHEFNNILANIQMNLDLTSLEQKRGIYEIPAPFQTSIAKINQQVQRAKELVYNVMGFAELREPIKTRATICQLVKNVVEKQKAVLTQENIEVIEKFQAIQELSIDKYQLEQALFQIILNARQAMAPRGKGTLALSSTDMKGFVILEIRDTGTGIKQEHLAKIFNPFFTTKGAFAEDGLGIPGIGLGLVFVHQIIHQHNGNIIIESKPGEGTQVKISLPV